MHTIIMNNENLDVVDCRHELNVREPSQGYRRRERRGEMWESYQKIGGLEILKSETTTLSKDGNRHNHRGSNHGWYLSILTLLYSRQSQQRKSEMREMSEGLKLPCPYS